MTNTLQHIFKYLLAAYRAQGWQDVVLYKADGMCEEEGEEEETAEHSKGEKLREGWVFWPSPVKHAHSAL